MTPDDLAEIRARHEDATPGRWEPHVVSYRYQIEPFYDGLVGSSPTVMLLVGDDDETRQEAQAQAQRNAVFVAAAHQDVPALCDDLEAAWKQIALLEGLLRESREDDAAFCAGYLEGQRSRFQEAYRILEDGTSKGQSHSDLLRQLLTALEVLTPYDASAARG